ncbi:hypothetical protein PY793_10445 [Acetobacter fabarum]
MAAALQQNPATGKVRHEPMQSNMAFVLRSEHVANTLRAGLNSV